MTEIRLRLGPVKPDYCRAPECRKPIVWYRTLNDRAMPMNVGAEPLRIENDVAVFDAADSHWATCPASDRFGRKRVRR